MYLRDVTGRLALLGRPHDHHHSSREDEDPPAMMMTQSNNIFLTWENFAFSLPLILVCVSYVSILDFDDLFRK
jgi:hypothetical protein